ncbi:MAG: hypothetical protein JW801_07995 [Bacteroidales bacterium]|nr:hypothetical protein [Bacteroidales bacterium]
MKILYTICLSITLFGLYNCTNNSLKKEDEKESDDSQTEVWEINEFVDAYGDPSGRNFVSTVGEGVFSNSATSNSYLFVDLFFTKTSAGILLHEYDMTSPAEKFIESAQIQMKNESGEEIVLNVSGEWNQSGGLKIDNRIGTYYHGKFDKLKKFLESSDGVIKAVIFDDYSSIYKFVFIATGFTEKYQQL